MAAPSPFVQSSRLTVREERKRTARCGYSYWFPFLRIAPPLFSTV
jgi:hypothetical protein